MAKIKERLYRRAIIKTLSVKDWQYTGLPMQSFVEVVLKVNPELKPKDTEGLNKTLGEMLENEDVIFQDDTYWLSKTIQELMEKTKKKQSGDTSFYENDDIIAEQVYDEGLSKFAVYDGRNVTYSEDLGEIHPINGDELEKKVVILPKKASGYKSEIKLAEEIEAFINRYSDVSKDFLTLSAYYVLLSWVYEQFDTVPITRLLGDTGTGKTRFLDVLGSICYKPMIVAGSLTPAPIYRLIEKWRGTLVIDEADFRESDESAEIVKILNCGFQKGKAVIRCNPANPSELNFFETFCPKLIATRRPFSDRALESRCLTENMKVTHRQDIPPILPKEFYEEAEELREKLLMFRLKNKKKIGIGRPKVIDFGEIEPRMKQMSYSLMVMFEPIPELAKRYKDFLKKYNAELVEERSQSSEGRIIGAIWSLKEKGINDIYSKLILDEAEFEERYRPNPRTVGKWLRSFGIKTQMVRLAEKTVRCIVWNEELMSDLKSRYIPFEPPSVTHETNETNETSKPEKITDYVSCVSSVSNVTERGEK